MSIEAAAEQVRANIGKLRNIAMQAAMSDGSLSHEESILIKHIERSIPQLKQLSAEMFEDGVIHTQENFLFQQELKQLLEEAMDITQADNKVEYGEKLMLTQLREQMMKLLKYVKQLETS